MIRINLLATESRKKSSGGGLAEFILVIALSLSCLGVLFVWWTMNDTELAKARRGLQQEQQAVSRLKKVMIEKKKYEALTVLLKKKRAAINGLQEKKRGPIRILDELSQKTPKQVWVESLRERKGTLEIAGQAEANKYVAEFMKGLERSEFFDSVELIYTQEVSGQVLGQGNSQSKRTKFSITCKANFSSKGS